MRDLLKELFDLLFVLVIDIAGVGGAFLICWGTFQIYRPAGFIVTGLFLLIGTILFEIGRRAD